RLVRAIATVFVSAVAEGPLFLRRLFEKKRRVALRTRFEHGLVPVNDVAVWIFRTTVENFSAFRFLDDDLALATRTRTRNADSLLLDVLALRIIRTGDELAVATKTFDELRAINRTFLIQRHWRRRGDSRLADLANVATLRITRAAEEWTKTSPLQ